VAEDTRCGAPTLSGKTCRRRHLPGFDTCLFHLPEDQIDLAERHGYRRCKATVSIEENPNFGLRCKQSPFEGGDYCEYHLQDKGAWVTAQNREQRKVVYRIHKVAEEEGVDTTRVANPLQALLELADEAMLLKEELRRRVVQLKEDEIDWRYEGVAGEQIRGEILLYERALDRCGRLLLQLARLGIEERLARVTERQAYLVNKALELALEEAGADVSVQDKIRESVAKHLRAVE
jgi:hypothetical protein